MSFSHEKLVATSQAFIDTLNSYISTSLNGVSRLTALNLQTTRAALANGTKQLKALAGARDLQELQSLQSAFVQPDIDQVVGYLRSIQEISREVQEQLNDVVQTQFSEFQKTAAELAHQVASLAPVGSDLAAAGVRSAFNAANSAFGNLDKAARQVSDIAEANLTAAENAIAKTAVSPSAGRKKAA